MKDQSHTENELQKSKLATTKHNWSPSNEQFALYC